MKSNGPKRAAAALERLGFTQYEAKVFAGLTMLGEASVSELYPVADVPRSAVYGVLEGLVGRGFVEVSNAKPTVYHALSPEKATERIAGDFEKLREDALRQLSAIEGRREKPEGKPEMIWLIQGHDNIRAKVGELMDDAKGVVFIGMKPVHMGAFEGALREAASRGVNILFLAMEDNVKDYAAIRDIAEPVVIPKPDAFTEQPNMGFIYFDNRTALVMSFAPGAKVAMESAFYSQSEAFNSFIQVAMSSLLDKKGRRR